MTRLAREYRCDLCGRTEVVTISAPWPARNGHHSAPPKAPPAGWWASAGVYDDHLCPVCRDSYEAREYHRAYQAWADLRKAAVEHRAAERTRVLTEYSAALAAFGDGPECPWGYEARARRAANESEP